MTPVASVGNERLQRRCKVADFFVHRIGRCGRVPTGISRRIVGNDDERDVAPAIDRVVDGVGAGREPDVDGVGVNSDGNRSALTTLRNAAFPTDFGALPAATCCSKADHKSVGGDENGCAQNLPIAPSGTRRHGSNLRTITISTPVFSVISGSASARVRNAACRSLRWAVQ